MQEQMIKFIGDHLSPFLCGYRKGYNSQYALIAMIEKWKKSLDNGGMFAAIPSFGDTLARDVTLAQSRNMSFK